MLDIIRVKFWGVRGSCPSPGADKARYGGNTPCVEINIAGQTIILDAGTGIIPLGEDLSRRARLLGKPVEPTLLFSHLHHDHIQGLPFFSPIYERSARLYLYGPDFFGDNLENLLAQTMTRPYFPVEWQKTEAAKSVLSLHAGQVLLLGTTGERVVVHPADRVAKEAFTAQHPNGVICIRTFHSYAHPGGTLVYRIEWRDRSVVYATDMEGSANTNQRFVRFAHGTDLLIHDAQYTEPHYLGFSPGLPSTRGWGHSTVEMACDVAREAGAKQTALFHFDPAYDDGTIDQQAAGARQQLPGTFAAYEGMEIHLGGLYEQAGRVPERQASNRSAAVSVPLPVEMSPNFL